MPTASRGHANGCLGQRELFDWARREADMSDFDGLDLQSVEEELDEGDDGGGGSSRVVLGVLDGTTEPEEWIATVDSGATLVLNVDGDLNELAAGFARDVKEAGGELMHFRGFLVVTPPGVDIDSDRLE